MAFCAQNYQKEKEVASRIRSQSTKTQKAASSDAASLNLAPLSRLERGRLARFDDSGVTLTWNKLVAVRYEKSPIFRLSFFLNLAPLARLELATYGLTVRRSTN